MQDCVMLDGRGDDVVARGAKGHRAALDCRVVGLGAAAGEYDLVGAAFQRLRHDVPRILQRLPGALPNGVDAGRIAEGFLQVRHHGLQRLRPQGRGRGVVQIDIALARVHQVDS